jgi:pilus assembly protein Flp/PilA
MNTMIRKFLTEEDGITAIEYGILAAVVAGAIVAIFGGANGPLQTLFTSIFAKLGAVVTSITT